MQVQIQKQGRSSRFPGWWIFSCCSRKQGGGLEVERSKLWRWKGRKTAFEQNLLLRTLPLLHFNSTLQMRALCTVRTRWKSTVEKRTLLHFNGTLQLQHYAPCVAFDTKPNVHCTLHTEQSENVVNCTENTIQVYTARSAQNAADIAGEVQAVFDTLYC